MKLGSPSDVLVEQFKEKCNYKATFWNTFKGFDPDPEFKQGISDADPSGQLLDLLIKIFDFDPKKRPTAQEVIDHPFFSG